MEHSDICSSVANPDERNDASAPSYTILDRVMSFRRTVGCVLGDEEVRGCEHFIVFESNVNPFMLIVEEPTNGIAE